MSSLKHPIAKRVGFLLLGTVTLIVFLISWPIRDQELLVRLQRVADDRPVELYNEALLCTSLPECFRIANKLVVSSTRAAIDASIDVFHSFPGSIVTEVPSWAPQYTRNLAPYLILRVLVLVGLAYALVHYLRRWWMVAIVSNLLLFWTTGVPIRAIARGYEWTLGLIGRTDFYPNFSSWHISRNSTIFLLEYDYVALLAVLIFPIVIVKRTLVNGLLKPFVVGAVLALTFENLAAVFIIGVLWSQWRSERKISLRVPIVIAAGWLVPIAALIVNARLSNPDASLPLVEITKLGYSINSEYRPLVLRLLVGFLVIPYLFGVATDFVLRRLGLRYTLRYELRPYIHGVVLGLMFSYLVGYFHSALATEFGRQSLGAQVLLFLSGLMSHQARQQRRVETTSATTAILSEDGSVADR